MIMFVYQNVQHFRIEKTIIITVYAQYIFHGIYTKGIIPHGAFQRSIIQRIRQTLQFIRAHKRKKLKRRVDLEILYTKFLRKNHNEIYGERVYLSILITIMSSSSPPKFL